MNAIRFASAVLLTANCLTASAGLSTNSAPPYAAISQDSAKKEEQRLSENQRQFMLSLARMGDSAAEAGIAYSQDEWVEIHNSLLHLGVHSLSMEFLETLRKVQNAKARQVAGSR